MSTTNMIASTGQSSSSTGLSRHQVHQQASSDFSQLLQALQSGDLGAAQQAYGDFQQLQGASGSTGSTAGASSTSTSSDSGLAQVASDWSALGQALQSGSLSSAQTAMSTLEQDAQSAWTTKMQEDAKQAQSVYALLQGSSSGQQASATSGTQSAVSKDISALSQVLQSGDTSSAQNLLKQLQTDLQASGQQQSGQGGHHHHHSFGQSLASAYSQNAATTSTAALQATA